MPRNQTNIHLLFVFKKAMLNAEDTTYKYE